MTEQNVKPSPNPTDEDDERIPYRWVEDFAEPVKASIQILIGLFALFLLAKHVLATHGTGHQTCLVPQKTDNQTWRSVCYSLPPAQAVFQIAGDALALSAAVELIYMLFTPGPDEAVEPFILGIASTALMVLGNTTTFRWQDGVTVFLLALALGFLFLVRQHFVEPETEKRENRRRQKKKKKPPTV